jgi:hypothetical protein
MKKVVILIAVAFMLGACGTKQTTARTAGRSTNGGTVGVNGNVSSTYSVGANWSTVVVGSDQVTTPGCRTLAGQSCAVVFNVAVNPGSQTTSPLALNTSTTPYQTTGTGWLTIAIYDSLTGNGTSAIAVAVPLASGQLTYNGNSGSAFVTFGDDSGQIVVGANAIAANSSGQSVINVNAQTFSDAISFTNSTGNNPGLTETLGNFQTSVCGIFQCYN